MELRLLLVFLIKDFLLRVAKIDQSRVKLGLRDRAVLFDLIVCQCAVSVEEEKDDRLVAVDN